MQGKPAPGASRGSSGEDAAGPGRVEPHTGDDKEVTVVRGVLFVLWLVVDVVAVDVEESAHRSCERL